MEYPGAVPRELPPLEPDPVIEAYKKDVDRTLIRESLKLTVEQRCERLVELQRFDQELKRAGERMRARGAAREMTDFRALLERRKSNSSSSAAANE